MLPIRQRSVFARGETALAEFVIAPYTSGVSCWVRLPLRRSNCGRLLQPEFEQCFARYFHLLAPRKYLHAGAYRRAGSRSNRCAFSAAGNRADDGSDHGPTSDFLCGIGAAALSFQLVVAADHRVVAAVDDHAYEFQLQLGASGEVARFFHFRQAAVNVGALARHECSVDVKIGFKTGVENVTNLIFRGIHAIDHADKEGLSRRNRDFAVLSSGVLRPGSQRSWSRRWRRYVLRCNGLLRSDWRRRVGVG